MAKDSTFYSALDPKRAYYIRKGLKVFKDKLFGKNAKDIKITVASSKLHQNFPPGAAGLIEEQELNHFVIYIVHKYTPTINDMLHTLAHEMGHAKDMYLKDLEQVKGGIMWRGRLFPNMSLHHAVQWEIRPWEVHAEGLRVFLMENYGQEISKEAKPYQAGRDEAEYKAKQTKKENASNK